MSLLKKLTTLLGRGDSLPALEQSEASELPDFRYHPNPIETGSVVRSKNKCECCLRCRGFIYVGPTYSIEEYAEAICPWCIADGSAHAKLDASFSDECGIGGEGIYGTWDTVDENIIDEVAYRTPGFCGWQQEQWWTHCGDAAQFLGRAGHEELTALGTQAIESIRATTGLDAGREWEEFFRALDKEGSPTAYVFKCRHCGALGGYQDCD